jgi:CheY-like chemotaxis protein
MEREERRPEVVSAAVRPTVKGKRCWVTGGSRGLGLAICRELARAGAKVAFTYSKSAEDAAEARAGLEQLGAEVLVYRGSVADAAHVQETAGDIVAKWGGIDVLVNNAGVTQILPIVFFGGREISAPWKNSEGVFALREAQTTERLLDYVYFFLHRSPASMPASEREFLENLHSTHRILEGKRALIVDDDMRNIFALATVLDEQGMEIVSANNGRDAIRKVESDAEIDVVLMDIMMPEMDGITTIKEIRKLPKGGDLPIIAVTAKAMKGDREKCIEAGAWDYLSKPVDRLHLLAVLRGWLHR